jgi:hypothetical protein
MRKTGTCDGSSDLVTSATSLRTVEEGPERPLSAGLVTLRPKPRWSQPITLMPREARVGKSSR